MYNIAPHMFRNMDELREFFRTCPACGHRFHIKLEEKQLAAERTVTREPTEASRSPVPFGQFGPDGQGVWGAGKNDNVRITIDIQEFRYTYRCGHCGHVWSEERTQESKESAR